MPGNKKNLRQTDRQFSIEEVKTSLPADLGSFRAQQIRWDYLSLIPWKVDSRFIDSYIACHSTGHSQKSTMRKKKQEAIIPLQLYRVGTGTIRVKKKAVSC